MMLTKLRNSIEELAFIIHDLGTEERMCILIMVGLLTIHEMLM